MTTIKSGIVCSAAVILIMIFAAHARPSLPNSSPVVLELFTSQGCSSCPPADALLARLAREPNIIAITRPVTYWDNLGWKDTLAREENTALQRAYANRGEIGSGVYTPQIVVQGGAAAVGSDEGALRRLIANAHASPAPTVTVQHEQGGNEILTISGSTPRPTTLKRVTLRPQVVVPIRNGENNGRSITYSNVVIDEHIIGTWSGGQKNITIPAATLHHSSADRSALIIQQGLNGPIVAARYL
jgi:hypothetical protein